MSERQRFTLLLKVYKTVRFSAEQIYKLSQRSAIEFPGRADGIHNLSEAPEAYYVPLSISIYFPTVLSAGCLTLDESMSLTVAI